MNRSMYAAKIQNLGKMVNDLREEALSVKWYFVAGILRGAEEVLLVAYNLVNSDTPENEL